MHAQSKTFAASAVSNTEPSKQRDGEVQGIFKALVEIQRL